MKTYVSVLRLRLLNGMQYKVAAIAGVATQFFWGFMLIMVYVAFYSHSTAPPPMTLSQVVNYIWLQQALLALVALWIRDPELLELITTGNIAYELCRPCDLYGFWYAKLLAQRLSNAMLRSFPILIIGLLLPQPYRFSLPPDITHLCLFLIAMTLGVLILVAVSMFIYISVFYTMSPMGSLLLFAVIGEFFSGLVIPIPLMPAWVQTLADFLPFRWTVDFPFRVYSGEIGMEKAWLGLGIQVLWLGFLIVLGRRWFQHSVTKTVVQGG
ncbi:ABC transporter permease [Alicyclobacillus curvatus]|nr:ABC transporter permease [Alicyclobacillus curvatus]